MKQWHNVDDDDTDKKIQQIQKEKKNTKATELHKELVWAATITTKIIQSKRITVAQSSNPRNYSKERK